MNKLCVNLAWAELFKNLRAGREVSVGTGEGANRPAVKKHAVFLKTFVHFTGNFVHILIDIK